MCHVRIAIIAAVSPAIEADETSEWSSSDVECRVDPLSDCGWLSEVGSLSDGGSLPDIEALAEADDESQVMLPLWDVGDDPELDSETESEADLLAEEADAELWLSDWLGVDEPDESESDESLLDDGLVDELLLDDSLWLEELLDISEVEDVDALYEGGQGGLPEYEFSDDWFDSESDSLESLSDDLDEEDTISLAE